MCLACQLSWSSVWGKFSQKLPWSLPLQLEHTHLTLRPYDGPLLRAGDEGLVPNPGKSGAQLSMRPMEAACTVQKHILSVFALSLLFRLTRNGRSFPLLYRHHLTPEGKTGHWLKCPWRNPARLRVGLSWWIQKCTRWFSAICLHASLTGSQWLKLGWEDEIKDGAWYLVGLPVHQHRGVEDGKGAAGISVVANSLVSAGSWAWWVVHFLKVEGVGYTFCSSLDLGSVPKFCSCCWGTQKASPGL